MQSSQSYPSTVSTLKPISTAKDLYPFSPAFVKFAENLEASFSRWRSIRGDGNCYYRAIGVSLLEQLTRKGYHYLDGFITEIEQNLGYFRPFGDILEYNRGILGMNLRKIAESYKTNFPSYTFNLLEETLQNSEFDEELVKFIRCAIANYLKYNYDSPIIQPFAYMPLDEVLSTVLQMGTEAEGLVFMAAPYAFRCSVNQVTQASDNSLCSSLYSSSEDQPRFQLNLWLRPGHYDLIYTDMDIEFCSQQNIFLNPTYTWYVPGEPSVSSYPRLEILPIQLTASSLLNPCQPSFKCGICFRSFQMDDLRTLDCDHRFCEDCLYKHLISGIKYICPDCSFPISDSIIEDILRQ